MTTCLAKSFKLTDSKHGKTFWDAIQPPHKASLLHQQLMDRKSPSAADLRQSYGHAVDPSKKNDPVFALTAKEDFEDLSERMATLVVTFDHCNNQSLSPLQRLTNFEAMPCGFVMCVGGGTGTEPSYITTMSVPTLTRPDASSAPHTLLSSVANRGSIQFGGFLHLLCERRSTIENWFVAVKASPGLFTVPLYSTIPMWKCLPTMGNPNEKNVIDVLKVAPLQELQDRFHRGHFTEAVHRGLRPRNAISNFAFWNHYMWHDRIDDCYPLELGICLPPARQAFLSHLFPPQGGWKQGGPDWCKIFMQDGEVLVPEPYSSYPQMEIPISAMAPASYVPT